MRPYSDRRSHREESGNTDREDKVAKSSAAPMPEARFCAENVGDGARRAYCSSLKTIHNWKWVERDAAKLGTTKESYLQQNAAQHSTTTYQLGVVLHPCDTQEQMEHVAGFFFSFPLSQGNEEPVSIPRIRRLWCRGGLRTRCEHEPCRVYSALDASNLCALVKITTVERLLGPCTE